MSLEHNPILGGMDAGAAHEAVVAKGRVAYEEFIANDPLIKAFISKSEESLAKMTAAGNPHAAHFRDLLSRLHSYIFARGVDAGETATLEVIDGAMQAEVALLESGSDGVQH